MAAAGKFTQAERKLTQKEEAFVREYLVDRNGTQAAIRAGYSAKSARQIGADTLAKPYISSRIKEIQDADFKRMDVSKDAIAAELAKLGFSDIRKAVRWGTRAVQQSAKSKVLEYRDVVDFVPSEDLDEATAAAISEVSVTASGRLKVKFHDKQAALVALGRAAGMFDDKKPSDEDDGKLVIEGGLPE